ncbi:MAG: GNAT family N-acetyltransferase [Myxococcales bacterium]|nr:MAG: GNAT family N-acetyltransferase [Myxococcales bacterium]
MVIRELGPGDLQELLGLYRDLHAEDAPPPTFAELTALWASIVSDPRLVYLGAFESGELLAACNAAVVPNLTRGARPYALIENVVTKAAARRRGLGAAVLRALLERCWAAGCYKVMLMSAASRPEAHRFYESVGFDGQSKHAFVMQRPENY